MYLTYRPTTAEDLAACLPLIRNGFAFDAAERMALLDLWRHLLTTGATESAVVEDRERPVDQRIVGFGLSVFISEEFIAEARASLTPPLAWHVLARWRQGTPPFLDAAQIRRANAGPGLNGLILHNGWAKAGRAEEEVPEVRRKIVESFFAQHGGYHLRCFLHEIYGPAERDRMGALGWRVVTDFAGLLPRGLPPESHPFLVGIRREDVQDDAFHTLYPLFHAPPPRFGFRTGEQDVLRRAMAGETDEEIAQSLYLSPWTVKKRWQAVYGRVAATDDDLLADSPGRGERRRRYLLDYLRLHPEELRPVSPPPRGGTG